MIHKNLEELNKVTKNLFFFGKFEPDEQMKLLEAATFITCDAGYRLFNEGDRADNMYIVIKGTVSLEITTQTKDRIIVASLHDGNHFGELGLYNKVDKEDVTSHLRKTSCVCIENCQLILLPITAVEGLFTEASARKMKEDVEVLQKTVFFKVKNFKNIILELYK